MDIKEAAARIKPFLDDPAFDFLLERMRERITNNEDHLVQDLSLSDEALLQKMKRLSNMRIHLTAFRSEMQSVIMECENLIDMEQYTDAPAPVEVPQE